MYEEEEKVWPKSHKTGLAEQTGCANKNQLGQVFPGEAKVYSRNAKTEFRDEICTL